MKPAQHVVPRGTQWAIRREGSQKITASYPTQSQATDAARKIAKHQSTELFIHGRDGRIRDRDSFGHDPNPPLDKKH